MSFKPRKQKGYPGKLDQFSWVDNYLVCKYITVSPWKYDITTRTVGVVSALCGKKGNRLCYMGTAMSLMVWDHCELTPWHQQCSVVWPFACVDFFFHVRLLDHNVRADSELVLWISVILFPYRVLCGHCDNLIISVGYCLWDHCWLLWLGLSVILLWGHCELTGLVFVCLYFEITVIPLLGSNSYNSLFNIKFKHCICFVIWKLNCYNLDATM